MKKLFLRPFFAGEKLDVVDQQCVERSVRAFEVRNRVVLQALHHVTDKALGMNVADPRRRIPGQHRIAYGLHEVGLAEADTTVDE